MTHARMTGSTNAATASMHSMPWPKCAVRGGRRERRSAFEQSCMMMMMVDTGRTVTMHARYGCRLQSRRTSLAACTYSRSYVPHSSCRASLGRPQVRTKHLPLSTRYRKVSRRTWSCLLWPASLSSAVDFQSPETAAAVQHFATIHLW